MENEKAFPLDMPPPSRILRWTYQSSMIYEVAEYTFGGGDMLKHLRIFPNLKIKELAAAGFYADDLQDIRQNFWGDAPALYVLPREADVVNCLAANTHHLWSYSGVLSDFYDSARLPRIAAAADSLDPAHFCFMDMMRQKGEVFGKAKAAVIVLHSEEQRKYYIQEWAGLVPNLNRFYKYRKEQ